MSILRKTYLRGKQRGQGLMLMVVTLPVVVGSLALVLDMGTIYFNQIRMQVASDSAVLAGGEYLPSYPDQAISTARSYAELNGLLNSEIKSVQVTLDNKEVTLTATRQLPCFFCAVLGEGTAHAQVSGGSSGASSGVNATATSGIVPIRAVTGVVPIGVDYRTPLNYGTQVILKQGQVGPGNWNPLALGGTGASNYSTNVENGYSGLTTVGDLLGTEPGNVVGPTRTSFSYRINEGLNSDQSGTFDNHTLGDKRVMIIPLVDFSNINGSSEVPLKGFAMMWIVSCDGAGNVTCYFIQESVPGAIPDPNGTASGATTPVLLK
jgi:putative Flp pilus-assembly TadE/G-like protein